MRRGKRWGKLEVRKDRERRRKMKNMEVAVSSPLDFFKHFYLFFLTLAASFLKWWCWLSELAVPDECLLSAEAEFTSLNHAALFRLILYLEGIPALILYRAPDCCNRRSLVCLSYQVLFIITDPNLILSISPNNCLLHTSNSHRALETNHCNHSFYGHSL